MTPARLESEFSHPEKKVMHRLGIRDRDVIRGARKRALIEGEDWALVGGCVRYREEGILKVAAALASSSEPAREETAPRVICDPRRLLPAPGESEASRARVLRVIRATPMNSRVLVCVPEGYPDMDRECWVYVRVRENMNFVAGTETGLILARPGDGVAWEFAGRPGGDGVVRHPRFRGRW